MRLHKLSFLLDFGLYVLVQPPREEPYRAAQGDLSRDWTSRAFRRKHNATALAPWLDSSVTLCNTIRLRVYSRDAEIPVDSLVQSNVNVCSSVIAREANGVETVARSLLYCAPQLLGRLIRLAAAGLSIVVFVVPVTGRQEVVQDKISHLLTQPPTAREVKAEMHPRKNAAERRLLGGG